MKTDLGELESRMGVKFNDTSILKQALTHRSFPNEVRNGSRLDSNERLEFFGDAIIEMVVTAHLFEVLPETEEGRMSTLRAALVGNETLSDIATELGLGDFLFISKGEGGSRDRINSGILADALEAVVAAIYLGCGHEEVLEFINRFILSRLEKIISEGCQTDPKGRLQELIQAERRVTPTYQLVEERGPQHNQTFVVALMYGDEQVVTAEGKSKKQAEEEAARKVLLIRDLI